MIARKLIHSLFFNLNNRVMINLSDLFIKNSVYLKRISDYCRATLKNKEELIDKELIDEGTAPTKSNYKIWSITPEGILIYFEDYQVASHGNSPQEVVVPYSFLLDIIKPDGPLADLLITQTNTKK